MTSSFFNSMSVPDWMGRPYLSVTRSTVPTPPLKAGPDSVAQGRPRAPHDNHAGEPKGRLSGNVNVPLTIFPHLLEIFLKRSREFLLNRFNRFMEIQQSGPFEKSGTRLPARSPALRDKGGRATKVIVARGKDSCSERVGLF